MKFKKYFYVNYYPRQNHRVSSLFETKDDAMRAADTFCKHKGLRAELSFEYQEEPKIYNLAFFEDGRCECHDSDSLVIQYKGKPPVKVIRVREVAE